MMHVVVSVKTDMGSENFVLDALQKLVMHISSIIEKRAGVEILAEIQTENPDDLIYNKLYKIKQIKKIFAKVLKENKMLYA